MRHYRKLGGIGEIRDRATKAVFTIRAQKDIIKIINILSKNPLNTKKYLDFKRAFELYISSKVKTTELIREISLIKSNMNRGRTNFEMPAEFKYRITPYWLLGFVEGDGSFYICRKNFQLYFAIVQHYKDSELMHKICDFLYNLPRVDTKIIHKTSIRISESLGTNNSVTYLVINHYDLIKSLIIPFFSSMTWRSKKFLDFGDFTWVFKLKEQGHHHSHKGKILINSFLEQMNNNRLSTSGKPRADRELLISQANIMLQGPSNYEKVGGKTWIISKNKWLTYRKHVAIEILDDKGNLVKTCQSITAVMDFLGVSRYIVLKRLEDGESIFWEKENRLIYIREVEV